MWSDCGLDVNLRAWPGATPALSEWGPRVLTRRSGLTDHPIDGSTAAPSDICLTLPFLPVERGESATSAPRTAPHARPFKPESVCDAFLCLCALPLSGPLCRPTLIARLTHDRLSSLTRCGAWEAIHASRAHRLTPELRDMQTRRALMAAPRYRCRRRRALYPTATRSPSRRQPTMENLNARNERGNHHPDRMS